MELIIEQEALSLIMSIRYINYIMAIFYNEKEHGLESRPCLCMKSSPRLNKKSCSKLKQNKIASTRSFLPLDYTFTV